MAKGFLGKLKKLELFYPEKKDLGWDVFMPQNLKSHSMVEWEELFHV